MRIQNLVISPLLYFSWFVKRLVDYIKIQLTLYFGLLKMYQVT